MSASRSDEASKAVLWHARNTSKPVKLVKFDPRAGGRQGGGDNLPLRRNPLVLQPFCKTNANRIDICLCFAEGLLLYLLLPDIRAA
jgi:hypothetical protein